MDRNECLCSAGVHIDWDNDRHPKGFDFFSPFVAFGNAVYPATDRPDIFGEAARAIWPTGGTFTLEATPYNGGVKGGHIKLTCMSAVGGHREGPRSVPCLSLSLISSGAICFRPASHVLQGPIILPQQQPHADGKQRQRQRERRRQRKHGEPPPRALPSPPLLQQWRLGRRLIRLSVYRQLLKWDGFVPTVGWICLSVCACVVRPFVFIISLFPWPAIMPSLTPSFSLTLWCFLLRRSFH